MGLRTAGGQRGWAAAVQISSFSHSLAPKVCLSTFDTGEENGGEYSLVASVYTSCRSSYLSMCCFIKLSGSFLKLICSF